MIDNNYEKAKALFDDLNWNDYPELICPFCGLPYFHVDADEDGIWYKCYACELTGGVFSYISLRHGLSPNVFADWALMEKMVANKLGD